MITKLILNKTFLITTSLLSNEINCFHFQTFKASDFVHYLPKFSNFILFFIFLFKSDYLPNEKQKFTASDSSFWLNFKGNYTGKEKYMVLSSSVLQEMETWEKQCFNVHIQFFSYYNSHQKLLIIVAMSTWHFPQMHFREIPLNICRKLLLGICPTMFLEHKLWAFAAVLCVYRVFYDLQGKQTDLCLFCSNPHAHA